MTNVVPAIIPQSFEDLSDQVSQVKDFVQSVQVDITDGMFVKSQTWPYRGDNGEFEKLLKEEIGLPFWEDLDYEFHLMIQDPEKSIENWLRIGATTVVVQIESTSNLEAIIALCKAYQVSLGLSLKPSSDISRLTPYNGSFDFIQCMGSDDLGHHGASLDPSVFEKIKTLRSMYADMPIAVDIGVSVDTAEQFVSLGVTKLVSGGAIFNSTNKEETIRYFESLER